MSSEHFEEQNIFYPASDCPAAGFLYLVGRNDFVYWRNAERTASIWAIESQGQGALIANERKSIRSIAVTIKQLHFLISVRISYERSLSS